MNKDQVKGRAKEVMGAAKDATGKLTGSAKLQVKGKAEKVAGKTQAAYGDAKREAKRSAR